MWLHILITWTLCVMSFFGGIWFSGTMFKQRESHLIAMMQELHKISAEFQFSKMISVRVGRAPLGKHLLEPFEQDGM
jgi:hypothetical protein